MKYVSIDLETSGLDPQKHSILQIGAVIDDLSDPKPLHMLPVFECFVDIKEAVFELRAAFMNRDILDHMLKIRKGEYIGALIKPEIIVERFKSWLLTNDIDTRKGFTPAGKNFAGFDLPFLKSNIPGWTDQVRVKQRYIDPAPLYWRPGDTELPTLQMCLDRAGIASTVQHTSVQDALDVIRLIRKAYNIDPMSSVNLDTQGDNKLLQ